jgi:hypothetical protein
MAFFVGAELASDSDLKDAIAGKPCSYKSSSLNKRPDQQGNTETRHVIRREIEGHNQRAMPAVVTSAESCYRAERRLRQWLQGMGFCARRCGKF